MLQPVSFRLKTTAVYAKCHVLQPFPNTTVGRTSALTRSLPRNCYSKQAANTKYITVPRLSEKNTLMQPEGAQSIKKVDEWHSSGVHIGTGGVSRF